MKVAFLLLSCDKYYDMLSPFASLFNRFWPDCPFDKYAATNMIPFENDGFTPILMGADISWSAGLSAALDILGQSYDYVFVTLEDLFLCAPVDSGRVKHIIDDFIQRDGNYIRLYGHFAPSVKVTDDFGILEKGIPYRQNCVYAIWKISTLKSILHKDENAWDFEKKAVYRGYQYDGFYAVYKSQIKILNTLIKGKWVPSDYRRTCRLLPGFQTSRPRMSRFEELRLNLKRFLFHLVFILIPRKYRPHFIK